MPEIPFQKTQFELIDKYIDVCRKMFSRIFIASNNSGNDVTFENLLKKYTTIKYENYDLVIDCFYILEDTQEAKYNFRKYGVGGATKDSSVGERYLRFYGLMNACFLQKEVLDCFNKKLNLELNDNFYNASILEYRNTFAAHSPNKKQENIKRSFIQCRFSLEIGEAAGYSSNNQSEDTVFKREAIANLLNEWDEILLTQIHSIINKLINIPIDCGDEEINKLGIEFEYLNKQYKDPNIIIIGDIGQDKIVVKLV